MGGTTLSTEIRIDPDSNNAPQRLKNKFARIVKQCEAEYGYDAYNGTWSTCADLTIKRYPYPIKRWTSKAKDKAMAWAEENTEKWETTAIPAKGCYLLVGFAAT